MAAENSVPGGAAVDVTSCCGRQRDGEGGSVPGSQAFGEQGAPPMVFDDGAGDGESDTAAAGVSGP